MNCINKVKNMKNKGVAPIVIILIALGVIILGGGGYLVVKKLQTPNEPQPNQQLVGSDRDTHGCIGSAGYSWCEAKQKCLRVWEEKCEAIEEGNPTIENISPQSGIVGTKIVISGKNLNGFEGETVVFFEKVNGEIVEFYTNSYTPKEMSKLEFILPNRVCIDKNIAQKGILCPNFVYITPGIYKVYVEPMTEKSNIVEFNVTK